MKLKAASIAILSLAAVCAYSQATYYVNPIPVYQGTPVNIESLNNLGQLAGSVFTSSGTTEAFVFSGGTFTLLGPGGGIYSQATALNNSGEAIGTFQTGSGVSDAFSYDGGTFMDLGNLGGNKTLPTAVNDSGLVVGYSETNSGLNDQAFEVTGGVMNLIPRIAGTASNMAYAVNNDGLVVGRSGGTGFMYQNGVLTALPSFGTGSTARGVNNSGEIVGVSNIGGSHAEHAFSYANGTLTDLGTLGGLQSIAYGINDAGQIVGFSDTTSNEDGFLEENGTMYDLNSLLSSTDVANGWHIESGMEINSSGEILAFASNSQDDNFFGDVVLTPYAVPEPPAFLGLGGAALIGLGWRRRR